MPKLVKPDFYSGILVALQHVAGAGQDTLYDEIIRSVDLEELVAVAKSKDYGNECDRQHLKHYGYIK